MQCLKICFKSSHSHAERDEAETTPAETAKPRLAVRNQQHLWSEQVNIPDRTEQRKLYSVIRHICSQAFHLCSHRMYVQFVSLYCIHMLVFTACSSAICAGCWWVFVVIVSALFSAHRLHEIICSNAFEMFLELESGQVLIAFCITCICYRFPVME